MVLEQEPVEYRGKVTISGSFRKFYEQISQAMTVFGERQIDVLSPKKSKIVNPDADLFYSKVTKQMM